MNENQKIILDVIQGHDAKSKKPASNYGAANDLSMQLVYGRHYAPPPGSVRKTG